MAECVVASERRPVPEAVVVKGLKQCDLWNAMRKFANHDIALIADVLYRDGPLSFGELRTKTDLTTNILNHNLIEMRKAEIASKVGKKYCLTRYGTLLVESIERIKNDIFKAAEDGIFQPAVGHDRADVVTAEV